jgi:hypothetical protein
MRYRIALLLILGSLCFGLQKKGKPRSPEVLVLEVTCRRMDGDFVLDGRVQVQSEKPLRGLHLLIDFHGTDKQVLQTKRGEVNSDTLDPGTESEFHMRVADNPRAVFYSLRAEDRNRRDLRIEKAGPFPIE